VNMGKLPRFENIPSICRWLVLGLLLVSWLGSTGQASAREFTARPGSRVRVTLRDGNVIVATVVGREGQSLMLETASGVKVEAPLDSIVSCKILHDGGNLSDPNYSRLLFGPTGRPLSKGSGYFSDYYVFFPGVSYGVTDNFSFMAGMSVIPGLNIAEQLKYLAPRLAFAVKPNLALSTGFIALMAMDNSGAGIGFAVATVGPPEKSLTAGIGFGYTKDEGDLEFSENPIIQLGGSVRISNSLAIVSENWLITKEFMISRQPFGLALRFFGRRIAADAGIVIIGEVIKHGFPIPWLSLVYNFGRK